MLNNTLPMPSTHAEALISSQADGGRVILVGGMNFMKEIRLLVDSYKFDYPAVVHAS